MTERSDSDNKRPVNFAGSGLPETILDSEPADCLEALAEASSFSGEERRKAVKDVVARWPRCLFAWANVGDSARDLIEAYAAYRVGYHRGLDRLRQNGWRGSGYVLWKHNENRGFLRCLAGLARVANELEEFDEAKRCELFLSQLDPELTVKSLDDD